MLTVRFIRFAKLMVLITHIWTLVCAVLIVGWQTIIFLREGSWQALPLSLVFSAPKIDSEVDSTASINSFADALLEAPIILLVLLAAAFLTAFYGWLYDTEKRLAKTHFR
jgi:hypothetical protein